MGVTEEINFMNSMLFITQCFSYNNKYSQYKLSGITRKWLQITETSVTESKTVTNIDNKNQLQNSVVKVDNKSKLQIRWQSLAIKSRDKVRWQKSITQIDDKFDDNIRQ